MPPEVCPACGTEHLRGVGEGTEQVEDLLRAALPTARILRLDRDTTSRKGSLEAALLAAEQGEVDVLVGTQMLAKGHNFPGLTLVGILNADLGLKVSDFRAAERTFQLLTQVSGRAGRGDQPGRVLLQTYSPEHPAVVHAVAQDFEAFAASELPYREAMGYPPFSHLTVVRSETETPDQGRRALQALRTRLEALKHLRVLGPIEAPIPRIKDRYLWRLILRSRTRSEQGEALRALSLPPNGPLSLDRDPVNLGM